MLRHRAIRSSHIRNHSAEIYRAALPKLRGLDRSAADQRLEKYYDELVKERNLERGLYAELYKGSAFESRVRSRIDPAIDFDWGLEAADLSLPKDNFSIRWSGLLKASVGGRYELVVYANAGARIWINDRIILDEPNLARKRNGVRILLELPPGLHAVRIEYWDSGGAAKMRLLWQRPGADKEEVVPPGCWYHDGYLVGR